MVTITLIEESQKSRQLCPGKQLLRHCDSVDPHIVTFAEIRRRLKRQHRISKRIGTVASRPQNRDLLLVLVLDPPSRITQSLCPNLRHTPAPHALRLLEQHSQQAVRDTFQAPTL